MKTKLLLWLMGTRFYKFLLKYVIPEIKFFHATGPNFYFKEMLRREMRAGDMLLSKSGFHLTNLLIGGSYSHAAVVVGPDRIAEMCAKGFDLVNVDKFCTGTTRFLLLRFKNHDQAYGEAVAAKAMTFARANYDTMFTLDVEALYCSELCFQSDFEGRMQADLSDLVGMGRPYLSPEGVATAKGLEVVAIWADSI